MHGVTRARSVRSCVVLEVEHCPFCEAVTGRDHRGPYSFWLNGGLIGHATLGVAVEAAVTHRSPTAEAADELGVSGPGSVISRATRPLDGSLAPMRRRLRKKLHKGEFTELGFEVMAELDLEAGEERWHAFLDRFIDAVEARQLGFGGGGGTPFAGFVGRLGPGSASDADREALEAFLASDPAVIRHEVGPLVDAWR